MERDPLKPANAEGGEAVVHLESAELSFHGSAAPVEVAPPLRLAGDEGMEAVGFHPTGDRGALAGRTPPFSGVPLVVGSPKLPGAVLTLRPRAFLLDEGRLAERDPWRQARAVEHSETK